MFGFIRAYARSVSGVQDDFELFTNSQELDDFEEIGNIETKEKEQKGKTLENKTEIKFENYYDEQDFKERGNSLEGKGFSKQPKSYRGNKELGYETKKWGENCGLRRLKRNFAGVLLKTITVAVLCFVFALCNLSPSRAVTEDLRGLNLALADTEKAYFTVYDYHDKDKVIFVKGDGINVGDEYLSADNKLYEIVSVDNKSKVGYAEFVCDEKLPKIIVKKQADENQAVAEVGKKVGVYHTHNDESYLDKDGTDSVYGKGGIHDVGAEFVKNLKSLGINVVYKEDLHLPHNSGAYTRSQMTASSILDTGNIDALFDIHRDSTPRSEYITEVDGKAMTKVRMVVGSANANYYENKEFAYAIKAYADEVYPNFIKDIYMGKGNYNQQLLSRGMLFEMGCEKIEKDYALRSTLPLAKTIDVVLYGSENASEESVKGLSFVDSNGQKSVVSGIISKKSTASISFVWVLLAGIAFYFVILGIVCIFSKTARYKVKRFFKELIPIKRWFKTRKPLNIVAFSLN